MTCSSAFSARSAVLSTLRACLLRGGVRGGEGAGGGEGGGDGEGEG